MPSTHSDGCRPPIPTHVVHLGAPSARARRDAELKGHNPGDLDRERGRLRLSADPVAEARREVFGFIAGFYNTRRLHSALGYTSPANFENLNHAA